MATGVDVPLILMCNYGGVTAVVMVFKSHSFEDLVRIVCERWEALRSMSIQLSYSLPEHPKTLLDNNGDLIALFALVQAMRKELVVVDVSVRDVAGGNGMDLGWSMEVDEEVDPLRSFCKHQNKVLLSAKWAYGISKEGQKFEGGVIEFRTVLCKYAIECGFKFRYVKNDLERVTAVCSSGGDSGCRWHVHARVLSANDYFYIRSFDNTHTCGVAMRSTNNPRMSSDVIASEITGGIRSNPLKRPIDVVDDFREYYGLTISYRQAWLGVEKAKGEVFGDFSESYDQLRWYIDAALRTNPGSYFDLEWDEERRFKRLFVAFHACITGFNHCRPLLFIDATFLKGRYKGNLMAATAKDDNQGLFLLCFAIVDSESGDNWLWFLNNLRQIIEPGRDLTFVSDRNTGLLDGMPQVFPDAHHGYCLQHLRTNLKGHLKGVPSSFKNRMLYLLNMCAYAPTVATFFEYYDQLMVEGGTRVRKFMNSIDRQHWSNAFFGGKRYGEMWSNVAESFNSWISKERFLPITNMADRIRVRLMERFAERRNRAEKWNTAICPEIEKILNKEFEDGRTWIVVESNDDVYEVRSVPSMSVDIAHQMCSCFSWQVNGIPCSHAICAIKRSQRDLNSFVDTYFHVQAFRESYANAICPIPTAFMEELSVDDDDALLPPLSRRPAGRPRTSRIKSSGENVKQIKCSRCGMYGNHNRRSCTAPI